MADGLLDLRAGDAEVVETLVVERPQIGNGPAMPPEPYDSIEKAANDASGRIARMGAHIAGGDVE